MISAIAVGGLAVGCCGVASAAGSGCVVTETRRVAPFGVAGCFVVAGTPLISIETDISAGLLGVDFTLSPEGGSLLSAEGLIYLLALTGS